VVPDFRSAGTTREQQERAARARHPGNEPTFPPTSSDVEEPRRSMRILPWWRRFWAWVIDFHTIVSKMAAIAVASVAAHVWIQGLVTRSEVHAEVKKAVIEALLEVNTDLATMKVRTGDDFPGWRDKVDDRLPKVEERASQAERMGQKANDRIDTYIDKKGGH
jgi:hypothetical protein